ncbi:LuxR C-terminal-related transcriptional regulator [Streptomyces sp. NPDC048479]|uniref:helix-turn-helix transcriptional regulator n=1 Tax=Streptomyces sp. NPDC048479 TaxID=3154725 RepID=UPI00343ACAAF
MQEDLKTRYPDLLRETEDLEELYRLAIRCQVLCVSQAAGELGWDDSRMDRAVRLLVDGELMRPLADDRSVLVPVAPRTAASRRLAPLHSQIARMERQSERIQAELAVFQEVHERTLRESYLAEPFQTVVGADAIAGEIMAAAENCDSEMLVARPGGGRSAADVLQNAWEPPESTLKRQVRARTLYQHSTRFDGPTRKRVERIGRAGGEVRTLGDSFEQMIIFDRELAFIPADSNRDVAVAIRQPGVVDFLLGVFGRAWVNARPFESQNRAADVSELVSSVRMSIIQLLAEGETDEAIARRIGLSVRTCRTHVAKIYQELGARSRCQLGVLIAQSGLLGQG